nr:hypothetical protein BaRGS_032865 [Batillaria attramentaria]
MAVKAGVRVLRGPNWEGGEADGGEGHLGTLIELLGNGLVRVLWDNGQESTCKAGADGKYELRIFDTAPIGVRHNGTTCAGCDEKNIYGMLWRCTQCTDCTLCPLCYVLDKHDTKHPFERIDAEGESGVKMKKRSISLRIRAIGIFPGADVTRGKHWIWGDQDGGAGSVGQVLGFENVAPNSSRNLVRVKWTGKGTANSYRLGFEGNVDIKCVDETSGMYYYREHLPVVNTTGKAAEATSASASSSSSSSSLQARGVVGGASGGLALGAGDKVAIRVGEEKLREKQSAYGGVTASMLNCIGKTGEVISMAPNGAVVVKFTRVPFRFNPDTLTKVPKLNTGDVVQIHSDLEETKALNKRVGWKSEMDETCGKVGRVVKIDEDGDVAVAFGRRAYMYAPACCVPAANSRPDELSSNSSQSTTSVESGSGSGSGNNGEQGDLHQKLMKMLARMMSDDGADEEQMTEMGQLFKAINRGDKDAVQSVCQAQPELMKQVHKGMTLLMVACHEAQRDIVNMLLDMGADINAEGEKGNTALGAALEGKKESIALLLLQRGASPTQLNNKRRSPAHVAAYNNMAEALREIVKRGADVNVKDEFEDAPLHDAIEKDHKEALDVLMEAPRLDLQNRNRKGFNMLQLACLRGNAYAVEKIVQRDRRHINDLMGGEFNALMIAVTNDHVECARLLIAEGNASLDMKGAEGLTALHLSCNEAYPRSVELLLNSEPIQCCRPETIRKGFQQFIKEK